MPKPVTVATEFTAGLLLGDDRHTWAMGPERLVLFRSFFRLSAYLQPEGDFFAG